MRCLYGDFSPSPLDDSFFELLPALVDTAAALLRLHESGLNIREQNGVIKREAEEASRELERVAYAVGTVLKGCDRTLRNSEVAEHLVRDVVATVNRHRHAVTDRRDQSLRGQEATLVAHRRAAVPLLSRLVLNHRMPGSRWRVIWQYTQKDQVSAQAQLRHSSGLAADFAVDLPPDDRWRQAVKIGSLSPELAELSVQLPQRSMLTQSLKRGKVRLAPYYVVAIDASVKCQRLTLARNLNGKGPAYQLERTEREGPITARLFTNVKEENSALALSGLDDTEVDALFRAVGRQVSALTQRRLELQSLTFEGQPVEEVEDLPRLVLLLLDSHAPDVNELCRRSPNPGELTLKRATGDRKREEIFLPLQDLVKPIRDLRREHQALFGCLGITDPAPPPPGHERTRKDRPRPNGGRSKSSSSGHPAVAPADERAAGPTRPLGTPLPAPLDDPAGNGVYQSFLSENREE